MNPDAAMELPKDDEIGPRSPTGFHWPRISQSQVLCFVAVFVTLGWAYEPNLVWLYETWVREPDYTHGFLVLPIALVILWNRWPRTEPGTESEPVPIISWWPGWFLIAVTLAARVIFNERGMKWMESATLLPVLVGLALAGLGWRMFWRVWPAFAFLIFLFPLPPMLNTALSRPLQALATMGACGLLRLTGLWVMPEGNVILVGSGRLEVAAACNGLSMLMSLAATVAAAASLVPMSNWKRILLLVSIVPIALGCNILRIAATAWCCYKFGVDVGMQRAHDVAGWLMMPTAMLLVGLELTIASWLIVESDDTARTRDRLGLELVAGPANRANLPQTPATRPLNPGERP